MKAINFYSSVYHSLLVCRGKSCTIRLGDKRQKYQPGDVVWVTYGDRFRKRKKLFTALVDAVAVKRLVDLTPEDLRAENPDMKEPQDAARFLSQVYGTPIGLDAVVSVVYFSEITE